MFAQTIIQQISMLEITNEKLRDRIGNLAYTSSADACQISLAINKNVETIAKLAADLEQHDKPKPVEKKKRKGNGDTPDHWHELGNREDPPSQRRGRKSDG